MGDLGEALLLAGALVGRGGVRGARGGGGGGGWGGGARGGGGGRRGGAGGARPSGRPSAAQARPPATQEGVAPPAAASMPARASPSRGPPVTTTMNTPCSRPRSWSGAYTCSIVCRYTAETRSAAPAAASSSTAGHSERARPAAATVRPQAITAAPSASPCRRTRPIHPEDSPPTTAPSAIAAYSQPTAPGPPNRRSAASGNSARGIASTMAAMSTTNDISSTGRPAMKRRPSTTERSPGRLPPPSGGSRGSLTVAYRPRVNRTASTAYAHW